MRLFSEKLYCARCGDCLNDPRVTGGKQCVEVRACDCHFFQDGDPSWKCCVGCEDTFGDDRVCHNHNCDCHKASLSNKKDEV